MGSSVKTCVASPGGKGRKRLAELEEWARTVATRRPGRTAVLSQYPEAAEWLDCIVELHKQSRLKDEYGRRWSLATLAAALNSEHKVKLTGPGLDSYIRQRYGRSWTELWGATDA